MFKVMVLLKRKPGLTLQQFIEHYENDHAPLVMKYQTKMKRFVRHYLHPVRNPSDGSVVEAAYDVLSEFWFDDRRAYDEATAAMMSPEPNKLLAEGEARFIGQSKTRFTFLEEHESQIPSKTPNEKTDIKCYLLLKRKQGTTMSEFIEYYENKHQKLGVQYSAAALNRYRRLFFRPAPRPIDGAIVEPAYDVATEVSFADKEHFALAPKLKTPEITAIIEADQANFLDGSTRNFVFVKDRESVLPGAVTAA